MHSIDYPPPTPSPLLPSAKSCGSQSRMHFCSNVTARATGHACMIRYRVTFVAPNHIISHTTLHHHSTRQTPETHQTEEGYSCCSCRKRAARHLLPHPCTPQCLRLPSEPKGSFTYGRPSLAQIQAGGCTQLDLGRAITGNFTNMEVVMAESGLRPAESLLNNTGS